MKAVRRLLVLSYHFPPDGAVGGLRWSGLSKYLARRGWEVHVVTAAKQSEPPPPGVVVHHAPAASTLNDLYNAAAKRLRTRATIPALPVPAGSQQSANDSRPTASWMHRLFMSVRRNISALLAFPDYAGGWILPATRTARALLDQYSFNAVVSSGPPHSAHVAGALACGLKNGILTVDMRDPWAGLIETEWEKSGYGSNLTRWMTRRLEHMIFGRARSIVTNTTEHAADVQRDYPSARVAFISNGIDYERLPAPAADKFDGLSIAYAGTLYLGRDLSPVIIGMRQFLERYPAARGALRLRLAGSMEAGLESKFRGEVAAANLQKAVETLGLVSRHEAMELINRSHLTLVLAQDQPTQIPAKIYESVGLGIPTLVIAEPMSAAAREADRIGAWTCDAQDTDAIASIIARIWLDRSLRAAAATPIGYDSIAGQMDALLRSSSDECAPRSNAAVDRASTTPESGSIREVADG